MILTLPTTNSRRVILAALPDGVAGIRATLALMVKITVQSKGIYAIRQQALDLVRDLPQKDWIAEIKAIHEFVRDNIRYVGDIEDIETVQTPIQTLQIGQGDCDDKALLAASLLIAINHPVRFVAVGRYPDQYEHVLIETKTQKNNWIPVETTEPVPVGWYPPNMTQRLVYHI